MTSRQKSLLIPALIWCLVLPIAGSVGGIGSVELLVWLLGFVVILVIAATWGRGGESRAGR